MKTNMPITQLKKQNLANSDEILCVAFPTTFLPLSPNSSTCAFIPKLYVTIYTQLYNSSCKF